MNKKWKKYKKIHQYKTYTKDMTVGTGICHMLEKSLNMLEKSLNSHNDLTHIRVITEINDRLRINLRHKKRFKRKYEKNYTYTLIYLIND